MPFDSAPAGLSPLAKMDRVISLLATERQWCKMQLRAADGRRCMLGAMLAADGVADLTYPVTTAIRQHTRDRFLRIEMFNDHPKTTHADVLHVLQRARRIIERETTVDLPWWRRLFARS